jgi:hypothetical protein
LAYAQTSLDFEARKTAAYQKFHHGEVRQAARDIRLLANETNDKATKAYLLRDLTEICAAAFEVNCTLEAEIEAFGIANSEQALKPPYSRAIFVPDRSPSLAWQQRGS